MSAIHGTLRPALAAVLFVVLASQSAHSAVFERDFSSEFGNQSGKQLVINTGAGDIHVRSGPDDSTHVQVKLSARASSQEQADIDFDKLEVDISESENGVTTTIRGGGGFSLWDWLFSRKAASVEVYTICPKNSQLVLNSGSGDIQVSEIEGEILLDTGSGDIRGESLKGSITADTGSGDVFIDKLAGSFSGDTGSGNIKVTGLNGSFAGNTGSGDIFVSGPVSSFVADTGSGSVVVDASLNNPGPSTVSTGSGDIKLYLPVTANVLFKAKTRSGDIQADFPNASIQSASDQSLHIQINQPGASVSAESGSGDIALYPGKPL